MSQSTAPWQLQGFDAKTAGHVNMFDPSRMQASNPPGAPTDALGPRAEQQFTNGAYNDTTYPNEWNSNYPPQYPYDPAQEYHPYDHPYQAQDHPDGRLPDNPGADCGYDRQDSLQDQHPHQAHAAGDPAQQNMWPPQQSVENSWNQEAMPQNWQGQHYHPPLPEQSPYLQQNMYYPQQTQFVPQDVPLSGSAAPAQFVQHGGQPPPPNAHDYPNMGAGPEPNDCVNTLSQPEVTQEGASEQHSRHQSGDANAVNDKTPQLFTSSSFSNLPAKPSPFDALESSVSSVDSHEQYPYGGHPENPALLAASECHSRGSSLGGNVHFTIGSESGSATHSTRDSPSTLGLSSEADVSGEKEHVAAAGALAPDLIAQSQAQDAAGFQSAEGGNQHNVPDAAMPPLPSNSVPAPEQVPSRASSVHSSEQSATEHPPYRPGRRHPSQSSDHSTADDSRQGAIQQAPVDGRDHAPAAMPGQLVQREIPGAAHMAPWIDHSRQPEDYFQQLPQGGAANLTHKQEQGMPDSQPLQQMSTPTEAQPSHQGPMTIHAAHLTTHPDSPFHPPRKSDTGRGGPGASHRTSHDSMGCPKMGLDGPDIIRGANAECPSIGVENKTHGQSVSSMASEAGSSIASSEDFPPTSGVHPADIHRKQNTMSPAVTLWKNPEPHPVGVTLALAAEGQSEIQASHNDGQENQEQSQPGGATTQSFHANPAVPLNVIDIQQHLQEEISSMGPLMSPGLTNTSQETNCTAANVASTGQTEQNATHTSNVMPQNPRIPVETLQGGHDVTSRHPEQQRDQHPQTVQQPVDNSDIPGSPYYDGAPQGLADGTRSLPGSVPKPVDAKIRNIGLPPAGTYQGTVSAESAQSRIPFQGSQDGLTSNVMTGTTGSTPHTVGSQMPPGGSVVSQDIVSHRTQRMGQRHPSESSSSSDHPLPATKPLNVPVNNASALPQRSSEERTGFIQDPSRDQQVMDNRQTAPVQSAHSVDPVQSQRSAGEQHGVNREGQASWQSQVPQVPDMAPLHVTASAPSQHGHGQPGALFDQFVAPLPPGPRMSAEREAIEGTELHSAPSQDSITGEMNRSQPESSYNSEKSRHSRDSDEGRSDRKSKDRRRRKDNRDDKRDDKRRDKYRDDRRKDDRRGDRRKDDGRDDRRRDEYRDDRRDRDRRDRDRRDRDYDKYYSDQNSGYDSRSSRRREDKYSSRDKYDDRYHYSSSSSHDSRDPDHRYRDGAKDRPRSRQGHPDDRYERPKSRQRYEEDYYNRPRSRQGHDYYDRPRSRQGYGDDHHRSDNSRHDRPRSRQDYYDGRQYYEGDPYYDYESYHQDRYKERYEKGYYEELQFYNQYPAEHNRGYDDYDRHSHHSHSEDYDRSAADHFARESHGSRPSSRHSAFATDESPIYPGAETTHHGYYESSYSQGAYDSLLAVEQPVPTPPPERLTPAKYQSSHLCVTFGPLGQLVRMLPNNPQNGQPGVVQIEENTDMEVESEELQLFPGPLIRGETHKKDVLLFCQKKARQALENGSMGDRFSGALIWKYLELLIKQNGTVVGTDIGELLLLGQAEHPTEQSQTSATEATSAAGSEAGSVEDVQTNVTTDRTVINKKKPSLSQEEVIHRFRDLLLHGHKKDALEWAMRQNDWGNAFFLAAKMDAKTHASVMTRFANQSMKLSDPLQTLYQLMSGRQPAAVSLVADEKWGDWRPHLAMILSNAGARPDLDKKAITTLGDTLASKRLLHSSQFCYLMAHVSFGHYSNKAAKLVLIGSDHSSALHEFLSNEAIQCTEVYEYAQSLASPSFQLIPFQTYKYLYAVRLSEMGLAEQALHYCEVISRTIQLSPGYYNSTLVSQVYALANRLKYCDPQRIQSADEIADPDWLIQLQQLSQAFVDGAVQPLSGTQTPLFANGSVGASSEQGDSASGQMLEASQYYQQQQYATDPTQAAQQSYTGYDYQNQSWQQHAVQPQEGVTAADQQQQVYGDQSYLQQQQQQQQQAWNTTQYGHFDGSYLGYSQQPQQQLPPGGEMQNQVGQPGTEPLQAETARLPDQQVGEGQIPDDDPNQLSSSVNSNVTGSTLTTNDTGSADTARAPSQDGGQKGFDYYGTSGQVTTQASSKSAYVKHTQGTDAGLSTPESPTSDGSSTPKASPGRAQDNIFQFGVYPPSVTSLRGAEPSMPLGATASDFTKPKAKQAWPGEQDEQDGSTKLSDTKGSKEKKDGGGSLFGIKALLSRFSRQKNEIKLPDDKNPKIVWDPDKQKWIDTDGGETDANVSSAPPPKDSELPDQPGETPEQTPLKPSPSAANRFSLQKGRGARSQYVDVLAGKSVKPSPIAPSNLFNVLPKSQSVPANLFVPSLSQKSDVTDAAASETAAAKPEQPASQLQTSSNQLPGMQSEAGSYQHPGIQQSVSQTEFKHPANIPGYTPSQYNQPHQGDQYGQSQYPAQPGAPPQAGSHPAGVPPQASIHSAQPGQQPPLTESYPAQYAPPPASEQYTHYGQHMPGQYAQHSQQQPISEQPTAYAPPQASLQQEESLSRSSSLSSISREVQYYMQPSQSSEPPVSAPPPASGSAAEALPAFYNPTQFSQSKAMMDPAPAATATTGRGLRYGQRRVYPKK